MAFAGARGIKSVELKVNNKEWIPAELYRQLSPLTWVLWVAELEIPPGKSTVTVRAMDGEGKLQTEESSAPHPDGASGYHSITIKQEA
jgi:sulfite oxidase